ncbi:hypothetical protein LQV63_21825 [Paenibacillus profundus]|uniref:Uncharacterized protein n=1 Tax=Paenibacillus profundus TaxID=1173085 RepID=A0ABS8YN88_9BACL|nr:hypothetical protein [Paenibacillus profundus]
MKGENEAKGERKQIPFSPNDAPFYYLSEHFVNYEESVPSYLTGGTHVTFL